VSPQSSQLGRSTVSIRHFVNTVQAKNCSFKGEQHQSGYLIVIPCIFPQNLPKLTDGILRSPVTSVAGSKREPDESMTTMLAELQKDRGKIFDLTIVTANILSFEGDQL
jgi:hypothetical protein